MLQSSPARGGFHRVPRPAPALDCGGRVYGRRWAGGNLRTLVRGRRHRADHSLRLAGSEGRGGPVVFQGPLAGSSFQVCLSNPLILGGTQGPGLKIAARETRSLRCTLQRLSFGATLGKKSPRVLPSSWVNGFKAIVARQRTPVFFCRSVQHKWRLTVLEGITGNASVNLHGVRELQHTPHPVKVDTVSTCSELIMAAAAPANCGERLRLRAAAAVVAPVYQRSLKMGLAA